MKLDKVRLLRLAQLRLPTLEPALGAATAIPSRVRIRSRSTSDSAKTAGIPKEHLAHRISRVVDLRPELQAHTAGRQ